LKGKGIMLSRLGGGIGTRGPGEKKLEVDRRRISDRITHLKKDLEELRNNREVMRKKRQKESVRICSLVGYTNAGKSTLFNALTESNEKTSPSLFTTLDTISHTFMVHNLKCILTDTVGFIYRLPPYLIEAFKATLEELQYADVLLHIVDARSFDIQRLLKSVNVILEELKLDTKSILLVFNKIDLLTDEELANLRKDFPYAVFVSALRGMNIDTLKERIYGLIFEDMKEVVVKIPFKRMELVSYIHSHCEVLKKNYSHNEAVYWVKAKKDTVAYLGKMGVMVKEIV
jgi:GTP-binding protein HflX